MLDIVRGLNAKYLTTQNTEDRLVDAVGMEMHLFNEYTPKKDCLISIMRQFAELGVRVYITEMDRNLTFKLDNFPDERDRWEYEACVYSNVMDACMESGVCDSFATWGVSDALSYLTDPAQKNLPESDPLLFDKYFVPKPAYFAVRDSLLGAHNSLTCRAGEPAPEMCPSGAELGLSD
jgi:endo-1,4-beta-xylanase